MCMHLALFASRAQNVPVSQCGGKQLKSTMTSTARAAGQAAERPASQARASQGSHKVISPLTPRYFSTYSLSSCLQGKGKAPAPRKASQTPSASQTKSASQGKVLSSSQSSQKVTKIFSTFRMSCCALQPDMRAPQGSRGRSGSRQGDA